MKKHENVVQPKINNKVSQKHNKHIITQRKFKLRHIPLLHKHESQEKCSKHPSKLTKRVAKKKLNRARALCVFAFCTFFSFLLVLFSYSFFAGFFAGFFFVFGRLRFLPEWILD
jgi:Fe2+ transport system protein B